MDLIVDHVHEFDHVLDTDGDTLIESFTGAAVVKNGLAVIGDAGFLHKIDDFVVADAVEWRGRDSHLELGAS